MATEHPAQPLFAQVSTKGQIVIPAELRDALKIKPGTRVAIERQGDSIVLRPVTQHLIDSLCGCLKSGRSMGDMREREHRDDEDR